MLRYLIYIAALATLIAGCKPKDGDPAPVIALKSVSVDSVKQFDDSLNITLTYSDLNGDLGEDNPDNNALEIKDSRLTQPDFYFVKPLSPPNTTLKIEGELTIKVRNMFLLGNGGAESATFTIRLRDRAGNWSNTITAGPVVITE